MGQLKGGSTRWVAVGFHRAGTGNLGRDFAHI